jgi:hypothetical protein
LFIIIPVAVTSTSLRGSAPFTAHVWSAVGRTLPYPQLHPKRPTASLVSPRVLASIVGQIAITSAVQFWTFFWVRSQTWSVHGQPAVLPEQLMTGAAQVHTSGDRPRGGRWQASTSEKLRKHDVIFGVVFPVHPCGSGVQHWASISAADVDKRCVGMPAQVNCVI